MLQIVSRLLTIHQESLDTVGVYLWLHGLTSYLMVDNYYRILNHDHEVLFSLQSTLSKA